MKCIVHSEVESFMWYMCKFCWNIFKSPITRTKQLKRPNTTENAMQRHYYVSLDQQFINKAVDQWRPMQAVIRAQGGHIEQLFIWLSASFWLLYEVVIGHIDRSTHIALVFRHCDIMMLGVLWLCCNNSNELLTYIFSLGFSMCTTEFQFTGYVICASKQMLQ